MTAFQAESALLLIDFINEIIDPQGKLAGKGYADFEARHGTLDRVQKLLRYARENSFAVIHVGLGFSEDYKELSEQSPLLGGAKKFGALKLGTWATQFHPKVAPIDGGAMLTKHRVSAFYGTSLDLLLRTQGVKKLFIVGCATDVAVQSAVREGHDRDYLCTVVGDCCIAATDDDHDQTLRMLGKVAKIVHLKDLLKS